MTPILHRKVRAKWLPCFLIVAVACGCRVGPDYAPPILPAPDRWHQEMEEGYFANQSDIGAWWKLLDDPVLDALIECSVDGNLDVHTALTRIWQARTQVCITNSQRFGSVTADGSYQKSKQSLNAIGAGGFTGGGAGGFLLGIRKITSVGLQTSWEPDVWGRIYREVESANATVGSNVEAFRDALVMMYGDIAASYVEVRTLQEQIEYAQRNVQIQERALELVRSRVEGGLSPILELHQSESNLAGTESTIPPLESSLHRALNRLAILAGEYPGVLHDCLATPAPIPDPPKQLPLSLPCDVIRQRPDIRQAERQLAARTAEIGVAVGDLYPRFRLGSTISLSTDETGSLFDGDSFGYQIGPSFTWLITNAGRVKCNIHRSKFAVEEALAVYQRVVLRSMEDVENAIVSYNKEKVRQAALRRAAESAQKQLESVLELYRNGKTNFQNVLDSLRTLFDSQLALANSEGETIQNLILIYRFMGGGWSQSAHCVDRCVRLRCLPRADATIVEIEPTDDAAEQYFDSRDDEDEVKESAEALDPGLQDLPQPGAQDIDPEKQFDVNEFFKKVLDKDNSEPPADGSDSADAGQDADRSAAEGTNSDRGEAGSGIPGRQPEGKGPRDPQEPSRLEELPVRPPTDVDSAKNAPQPLSIRFKQTDE